MSDKLKHHFKQVPKTGVIYIMSEAQKKGYHPKDREWVNLGQGQPEATNKLCQDLMMPLIDPQYTGYGPADGILELKETVAEMYNQRFRHNQPSKYTHENVVISPGGRAGLTRIVASLGNLNLGHFLPDYTAYEELLGTFNNFTSIPIALSPDNDYKFTAADLEAEIIGKGLSAVLLSNPCNPTGKLVYGDELKQWVKVCSELNCALILDEFYSKYIWAEDAESKQISAAEYVDDINTAPILIFDGITKNWQYPGLRISWTIGPKNWVKSIASSASFLDGGPGHPNQVIAMDLLKNTSREDDDAFKAYYQEKRDFMIQGLTELGLKLDIIPEGTFYLWCDVSDLHSSINDGMKFFLRGLEEKLITIPGEFFDINPGRRRFGRQPRFKNHIRLSFGPSKDDIQRGLDKIARMMQKA